jgi:4-hydroxybenzoate polyprenyltransferase
MSAFYTGGMCLNDIFDAAFDEKHNPGRPIPSGRLTRRNAWKITVLLFGLGLLFLYLAPHRQALPAGILLLAAIVIYDRYHKNQPWSVFVMGACRYLVFAVSALAVSGRLAPLVILAGIIQFVYVLILSATARWEQSWTRRGSIPIIPVMIAGISVLDGIFMGVFAGPLWLLVGAGGALLTIAGQRYVRGD